MSTEVMTALTGMIVAILGYITVFFSTKMNDIKKESTSTRENSEQSRDTANALSDKMDALADAIGTLDGRLETLEWNTTPDTPVMIDHPSRAIDDTEDVQ